jgi:catechol 2,3-dioxygenase-like lactoylglutathione lyase family enzyme
MKLNHLNLTVTDAAETAGFLCKYFGLRPLEGAPRASAAMAFVTDDNGMVLSLFRERRDTEIEYPGFFHIGFIQESEERVNEINRRLNADGFDVPPPDRQHGSWTFYFRAPGGFMIEVLG